ncbi:MAG: TAT-variant-translocated molybdopterin oxidoreductase [Candidatus Zixiibacteriota bacterium]|nr:MAG: TAT-variant-translocated molybdopterin oxidoreductase [candidate division Zixibacteria bacterium]
MKSKDNKGKAYWRSLDELAGSPEFRKWLHREFPQGGSELNNDWSRRNFLTLMGASLALAGLAGCRRPEQKIVPYVKPPEEVIPGIPQYYATTMPMGTSAYGIIVESHEGRPTKIEGNPKHPSTLGASNAWIQASILGLYDPDRSKRVMRGGQQSSWDDFVAFWREHSAKYDGNGGEGLAVLSEPFSSPTLARLKREFEKKYPRAKWVTYDPVSDENIYEGMRIATGEVLQPVYDLSQADVIVSIDCDFLGTESENIALTRGFAEGRRLGSESDSMNRLYVLEEGYSITGAAADHRYAYSKDDWAWVPVTVSLFRLAAELMDKGLRLPGFNFGDPYPSGFDPDEWYPQVLHMIRAAAADLLTAKSRAVVVAGRSQPPAVHALALALNDALGSLGTCVKLYRPGFDSVSSMKDLVDLTGEMRSGRISTLITVSGDPAYNTPADAEFTDAFNSVEHSIHLSDYVNETSRQSTWHIPKAHYLESWGDAQAAGGTASVIQPLIAPLYGGVSPAECLNTLATGENTPGYDIVRKTWRSMVRSGDFERQWRRILHDGSYEKSLSSEVKPKIDLASVALSVSETRLPFGDGHHLSLALQFRASPSVFDGRFANNGWLQELPHPITRLTWDNAALISPRTAEVHNLRNEDVVKLTYREREIELPVWIVPGMADNTVLLELGYGQKNLGRVANAAGFNAYALRDSRWPDFDTQLSMTKLDRKYPLASTQDQGSMEGRPLVREATLEEYRKHPNFAPEAVHHPPLVSMWEDHKYDKGYQLGMAIDLTACTGCNACTIACQSENNIPIVGKEQVRKGREMHWIRVDRYFIGDINRPAAVYQPVACQHCEMAPCEQVCPVAATMHDDEGLNAMVYNRCIGTRYCSNNCPYKVRRFNFFNFTKDTPEVTKMVNNPDVTVRSRGVMEKCTYCVQRINRVRIEAKKNDRQIGDGEIQTACQQACPTEAIVFGNVNDPGSRVAKVKKRNRNYDLLGELNIRPRTSYLAKIRNPNPEVPET